MAQGKATALAVLILTAGTVALSTPAIVVKGLA